MPPSRFGEPPLPALPLPLSSGDEDLFSPGGNDMSPNCCGETSPTFESKPMYREMEKTMEASRFVAQHVKNKDKFECVSIIIIVKFIILLFFSNYFNDCIKHVIKLCKTLYFKFKVASFSFSG